MILVATYQIWNGIFEEELQFSALIWQNHGCQLKSLLTKQLLLNCFVRFIFLAGYWWCWNLMPVIFPISHLSSLLCFCHQAKLWCMERAGQGSVSFKIYTSLVTNLTIVGKPFNWFKSIFICGEIILSFQFEKPIEEGFWSYLPRKRVIYIHLNNRASPSESP